MCPNQTKRTLLLEYTLPKLHIGKNVYIDFFAYDPLKGEMRRKKIMLDGIPRLSDKKKRAAQLIEALVAKLSSGWNPWVDASKCRLYSDFADVVRLYEGYLGKLIKEHTRKTYKSCLTIFLRYLETRIVKVRYVYQIDEVLANDFLDWAFYDREVSARTRNNYRLWLSTFCTYLVERKYLDSNPIEGIKEIDETPKFRQPLPIELLKSINEYLAGADKYFLLACKMEYYTFIRPTELSYIRLCDINIQEQSVFISGEISKNKRDAKVGLNTDIIKLMIDLDVFSRPGTHYLFGQGFSPSANRIDSDCFNKRWAKMRQKLRFGKQYQFYSLKDSGIRDLANAEGIVIARDQARHSDISTTNKYLQGRECPIHAETKGFKGYL